MTRQPQILALCDTILAAKELFLLCEDVLYKVDFLVKAVDICFKVFFIFNAEYPVHVTQLTIYIVHMSHDTCLYFHDFEGY